MILLVLLLHIFGGNNPLLKDLSGAAAWLVGYSYVHHFFSLLLLLHPIPSAWGNVGKKSMDDVIERYSCKEVSHHERNLLLLALLARTAAFLTFLFLYQQNNVMGLAVWELYVSVLLLAILVKAKD